MIGSFHIAARLNEIVAIAAKFCQFAELSKPASRAGRPPDVPYWVLGTMILGFVSKHVVASLRDAKYLRLGETQLRESEFGNKA